ncbi:hypothetical protein ACFY05_01685 [Microtetraspora fusca]|uniref:M56 family metallopeptidase n=1 Tax=Microtetraspora fusca TaxID=1997 RepID=A0ABW6UWX4_MICFU
MNFWLVAAGISLAPIMLGGRLAARLATAPWTHQSPRAALALWQAIGLAGGLGAIGIGLVAAVTPLAAVFPHGAHTLIGQIMDGRGLGGLSWMQTSALAWSVGLAVWLLIHTIRTTVRTVVTQRRQRLLVDLVADRCPSHNAYVLPDEGLAAYCVPGWRSRIVLTRGRWSGSNPRSFALLWNMSALTREVVMTLSCSRSSHCIRRSPGFPRYEPPARSCPCSWR